MMLTFQANLDFSVWLGLALVVACCYRVVWRGVGGGDCVSLVVSNKMLHGTEVGALDRRLRRGQRSGYFGLSTVVVNELRTCR